MCKCVEVQHIYQTTAPEIISHEHLPSVVSIFRQTAESLNSDHSKADTDLTSERGKREKRRQREKEMFDSLWAHPSSLCCRDCG